MIFDFCILNFMHEITNEPISIIVHFDQNKVLPLYFKWRNRRYKIDRLNLVHKKRDGKDTIYYFNVTDKTNYFKLSFSTKDLGWKMEELYYDG